MEGLYATIIVTGLCILSRGFDKLIKMGLVEQE